ncbi:MAG: acetylornithine deacetylase [Hahellaceae bacterium]|nr:acetylornithine deacetylase [Hahellaceae bacterium]
MSLVLPNVTRMLSELVADASVSCASPRWDLSNASVIARLATWFSDLGFVVEVLDVPGHPGKQNLIATLGTGEGGLVLSGHSDTVPFDEQLWKYDPLKLQQADNRFYGLGTCDMKGFFPLIVEAVKKFKGQPFAQPLIVLATADEESSMSGARALSRANFNKPRAAVIGEPTNLVPVRMHKGIMMEAVRISGRSGHSSNPALGNNALDCMHSVLGTLIDYRNGLQQKYRHAGFEIDYPTLNLGHIHGGDNPNRICGFCELQYDLRPLPGMHLPELQEQIKSLLAPLAAEFGVQVDVEPLFPSIEAFETLQDAELVRLCEKMTGNPAESVAFATEAPFLQNLGMETIVLGAGSIDQAHQPDEFLAFDQINPMINILEQLISHYCVSPSLKNT